MRSWMRAWAILPLLIFLAVFFVFPVGQLLWLSVLDADGEFTTAHFARLASTPVYFHVLWITFKIAAWTTVLSILCGYPVAYLIARSRTRSRDWLILLVLLPFWTSFLVRTFAWIILLGRNGIVNQTLVVLGITDVPVEIIYNFVGVMIGMVHAMLPLMIVTMLSIMEGIDPRLTQAANTLGARGGQAFWRIYFPLSLPGIAAGGLLVFITSLGFFITPALLGGARETMLSQVIITAILQMMDWAFAGALALLLLSATVLVFIVYDRLLGVATLSGGESHHYTPTRGSPRWSSLVGAYIINGLGKLSDGIGAIIDATFPHRGDRRQLSISRGIQWCIASAVLFFMLVPSLFVIPVSFTSDTFLTFPPRGFSLQWYEIYWDSPGWISATIRSLVVALLTGMLATVLGTAAAFVLARQKFVGRMAVLTIVLSPLIMPRMIIAVALFYLFAGMGLIGTNTGLVIGHTVLAVPYVVITVIAVLRNFDERQEHAAWTLGATKWKTFYHITLPQIRPGLLAGFLFAYITSFDDLTIALFISGGLTSTLPKQMWNDLLLQVNPTLAAVSTIVLILISVFILIAEVLRRRATRRLTS